MSDPKSDPSSSAPQTFPRPSRGHGGVDAGYDLLLDEAVVLQSRETSGWIALRRPAGCVFVLYFLRSSIQREGVAIAAVDDREVEDEVRVRLTNSGHRQWMGRRGDRVVQALFLPHPRAASRYVMSVPREPSHFPHLCDEEEEETYEPKVQLEVVGTSMRYVPGGWIIDSEYEGGPSDAPTGKPKSAPLCDPGAEIMMAAGETILFNIRRRARLQANQALLLTPGARCREAGVNVQGVVDPGYSGPIMAIATNTGRDAVVVNRDFLVDLTVVRVISAMDDVGTRGEGGFGSSGR